MRATHRMPVLVVLGLLLLGAAAPADAADDRPATVPAMTSFSPAGGTFALRRDARVVLRRAERDALGGEARTLAADLGAQLGRPVRVRIGPRARSGDVLLTRRAADPALGDEGYALRVGRVFTVIAPARAGLFYGGRTLLQLVRGGAPIPRGRGRDVPRYRERGLMVDCGRVFFDRTWWLARIRELADLKLNLVHLHLSDDQGFRIAVPSHPEIVSREHLTAEDVRALVAEAARRHVTLVPEVELPGHMTAALAKHPELQLRDALGRPQADKLDVTLPAARAFAHAIVGDVLAQFPGPWFHAGNDEYLGIVSTDADYLRYPQLEAYSDARYGAAANGKDAVLDLANEIAAQVHAAGKEMRVWSDGATGGSAVTLDPRVAVEWWENLHSATPQELVAAGRQVLNVGWWPLYYVTGGPLKGLRASEADMYERWDPASFEGPYTLRWFTGGSMAEHLAADEPRQLGATLAVWNDDPASPDARPAAIATGIRPRLAIVAQQTWGSRKPFARYPEFRARAARLVAPGQP